MNFSKLRLVALLMVGAAFSFVARAAAPASDLIPPERRQQSVDTALRYAAAPAPRPLPTDIVHPFNPPAFGQPDAEELRALAAARAAANAANAKPSTDRDLLEEIASRIEPSGTLILGGEPLLIFGQKRLRVGDRLTVTYGGHDYDLELTAIERTTFTLRLNSDELTRPIKLRR